MLNFLKVFVIIVLFAQVTACSQASSRIQKYSNKSFSYVSDKANSFNYFKKYTTVRSGDKSHTYRVQKGDALYSLARKFGVSSRDLIDANNLRPPYNLKVGQKLKINRANVYRVKKGDTLYGIAKNNSVPVSQLVSVNGLKAPYNLTVGQVLKLPYGYADSIVNAIVTPMKFVTNSLKKYSRDAKPSYDKPRAKIVKKSSKSSASKTVKGKPVPILRPRSYASKKYPSSSRSKKYASSSYKRASTVSKGRQQYSKAKNNYVPPGARPSFSWPVKGNIITRYGSKSDGTHNDGINISASEGSSIRAAASGEVVYSGNDIKAYGNLILVRHQNGWVTAYAHQSKNLVKKGQKVKKGQTIGKVGATGFVDRPQLHFAVRKGRNAVNPENYL